MGTSKSNPGIRPTPLLPSWAPSPPESDENPPDSDDQAQDSDNQSDDDGNEQGESSQNGNTPEVNPTGDWSGAKRRMTNFARSSDSRARGRALRGAAKAYVRGSGGSRTAAKSAIHGKAVGVRLGGVLSGISSEGVGGTFEKLGLGSLDNLSVEAAFNKLAQHLCSNGATIEESVANVAAITALSQLYEDFDLENNNLDNLDSLSADQVNEIIQCYVSAYIYERWLHELGASIEGKEDISTSNVVSLEEEVKEFVTSSISLEFGDADLTQVDFEQGEGRDILENIFQQAYEQIETL